MTGYALNMLNVRVSSKKKVKFGPFSSPRRISQEFKLAKIRSEAGDDSVLRSLSDTRYCIERISSAGDLFSREGGRRGKFSNPLFLTPSGFKKAYPEHDEDMFADFSMANKALESAVQVGSWEIRQTTLAVELKNRRYLRWLNEVKGMKYTESRRSLDELADIYQAGGVHALKKLYSRTHVCKIVRDLKQSFPDRFSKA